MATKAFLTLDCGEVIQEEPTSTDILDTRNYIYVRNPTYTIESYLRYLNTVKPLAMMASFQDYMLQLGYIPIVMPPSFWGDRLHNMILPHLPKELPRYPRPATSFLNFKYHSDFPDIWVSKLDAAEFLNCAPQNVRVREVLRKCGL